MAKFFTPIQSVASAGLLKNQGFGVSSNLVAAVNGFNNLDFVELVNSALAVNTDPAVTNALNDLPEFLTGKVSVEKQNLIPNDLKTKFDFTNLINDVRNQANLVLASGSIGLVDILPQVNIYCKTIFDLTGSFAQVQNTSFNSFGITIKNYHDILTGGVSSQYREVSGGINSEIELDNGTVVSSGFASLVNQIGNFGTMYDIKNLTKLNDPRTLCQNLLSQGFYQISKALSEEGVSIPNLPNEDVRSVLSALSKIKGSDLKTILSITKFKPYRQLENLAEVLDIQKVLSPAAATAAGGSFSDLSRKLTNIGGSFSSFSDVKVLYSSIQTDDLPYLSNLGSLAPVHIFVGATDSLGNGTGIFGNPVVTDVIGSAGGIGYTDKINELISIHNQLISSVPGNNLKLAIEQSITTPNNSTVAQQIENQTANFLSSNLISNLVVNGSLRFEEIFNRLLNERKNVVASSIDLTSSSASVYSVVAFVNELHNIHRDISNLRYGEMIKSITANNVFGEAIFAAILEGNNIYQLNNRNISNYTKLDPLEYATWLSNQNFCN